ncbi:Positive regulator of CheA protein activity (CheW) [Rubellimicrobium mesophilum DSM 19309]|uniref:Positive regulator of CheA protein activity (CheW) n=1 Tax=Rubellimicrobium mesophilum DSM 19309 TaxID=442562 RepID=A0A017HS50_9RHOB|nr:chemotaxis protein CheW [Rubellimicrobium mesophilum]EYD76549.1 Positive regulator of CheA protein activity (CheW) [Rubellimicrobium mesophilum DSM 19309]
MQDGPVVTFGMGESLFALPVALVQEILDPRPVSRLPNAPRHLLGVIDVRGSSVAVIDLRTLLGESSRADQPDTRIMVLQLRPRTEQAGPLRVALRVDRVIEVTGLDDSRLEPLAEAAFIDWDQRMVEGIGRRNGTFVAVLRVEGLFDRDVISTFAARSPTEVREAMPVELGTP